MMDKNIVL